MARVTSQALNNSFGKERRKRRVFRRLRKTGRDDADVTWRGRSFQVRAVATGKARSPTVDSCVRRTGSDVVSTDRNRVLIPRSARAGGVHRPDTSVQFRGYIYMR